MGSRFTAPRFEIVTAGSIIPERVATSDPMLTTTTETVPGHEVAEVVGVARGNTVEARNVGRDVTQSLRNLASGAVVLGPDSNGNLVVGGPRDEVDVNLLY